MSLTVSTHNPVQIAEMRNWIMEFGQFDADKLSDAEVVAEIDANYSGGIAAFEFSVLFFDDEDAWDAAMIEAYEAMFEDAGVNDALDHAIAHLI